MSDEDIHTNVIGKPHCDSCFFSKPTDKPHTFFCHTHGHTVYDVDCCIHYTNKEDVEMIEIPCDGCGEIIPILPDGFTDSTICKSKGCQKKIFCHACVDESTHLCKKCSAPPPHKVTMFDWIGGK